MLALSAQSYENEAQIVLLNKENSTNVPSTFSSFLQYFILFISYSSKAKMRLKLYDLEPQSQNKMQRNFMAYIHKKIKDFVFYSKF